MPRPLQNAETALNALNADNLLRLPAEFGCPVWVYDAQIVREKIAALHQFDVVRFAQKACSNIHILRLMREQGVKVDSVSLGEIERALAAGYDPQANGDDIVFTADLIDSETLVRVHELQIPVNAGSVDMLEQLGQVSPGHRVWLRVNPGFGHGHSQKTNTGGENSKHGIWYSDLPAALAVLQRYNLKLVGIHMHIGSETAARAVGGQITLHAFDAGKLAEGMPPQMLAKCHKGLVRQQIQPTWARQRNG
jgi:diaminopimelate decarboxylase